MVVILRLLNAWALWLCYDCFATSNDDPTNEYQPNESSTNRPNIIIGIGHFLDEFMLASPFLLVLGLSMRPSFNLPSQQQPAQSSLTNELVKESCIELGLVRELCLPQRMNVKLANKPGCTQSELGFAHVVSAWNRRTIHPLPYVSTPEKQIVRSPKSPTLCLPFF